MEIERLVGHRTPHKDDTEVEPSHNGVTWVHREVWPHAYPTFESGHPLLDDIEIAPHFFYTAAGEEVLSSMEMSRPVGLNVAKVLYYSKWIGETFP